MGALHLGLQSAFAAKNARKAKPFSLNIAGLCSAGLGFAALSAGLMVQLPKATAVPSYARQTGQPCATCHTAFPELTPFGRQFKLMGYTSGGTRCGDGSAKSDETQVPLSAMAWPATFTHVKNSNNQAALGALPNINNDDWMAGQFSFFVAGQLYCDVGAFAQVTYDRTGPNTFGWDNTDIRYAKTGVINGTNIVYGITANNNPTVQDVWNSTPAWSFPYIGSEVAPSPAAGTMLGAGSWAGQAGGVGGYVWINNMIYLELTGYGALPPQTLINLGADPTAPRFNGVAPYWRAAVEKTWDKNSLMIGTFGMYTAQQPVGLNLPDALSFPANVTNPFLDIGIDTQYQWIGEEHIFTLRGSYIWERQQYSSQSIANGIATNSTDYLYDFKLSASYIYDRTYSFTAGYFATWGTADSALYANSSTFSPNSSGWNFDLAYLPFSNGGPDLWPWFNARIGVQYTHYDKFDGSTSLVDFNAVQPLNLKASGNDTVFLYSWLMF
jgi:hypothetical protein